jgi:hypothetical protein
METKWEYQEILRANKVENKFDNFLSYLLGMPRLKRKGARDVGGLPVESIKLGYGDCALVYNPRPMQKHPVIMLYSPILIDGSCEHFPHLIMMATLANMISDKDPEFEALIAKKVTEYLEMFEKKPLEEYEKPQK